MSQPISSTQSFRNALLITLTVTAVALLVLLIGATIEILMLVFLGLLFGLYLKVASQWIAEHSMLPRKLALGLLMAAILGVVVSIAFLIAPAVSRELVSAGNELSTAMGQLRTMLEQSDWSRKVADDLSGAFATLQDGPQVSQMLQRGIDNVFGVFSTALGTITGVVVIFVVALYVSLEPQLYANGLLRLFPRSARNAVEATLGEVEHVLTWWLIGQSVSMTVLGVTMTAFLVLMDVPLAFLLGAFTAIMTFIPNLGPIIAGVPAILLAFSRGPVTALATFVFIVVIQNVEGFLITPMVHRRIIALPPALVISVQMILATLVGLIGIFVAMPIIALGMVLIQRLYLEAFLGDSMSRPVIETAGETVTSDA